MPEPAVLFYCQHVLGMGHLVRSLALARALADRFRVVFLNVGPVPRGLPRPAGVEFEDEQCVRARRLEQLGAVRVLEPELLDGPTLAAETRALLGFRPSPVALD